MRAEAIDITGTKWNGVYNARDHARRPPPVFCGNVHNYALTSALPSPAGRFAFQGRAMAKPVNLTEHRNTIEKRRRRAMRDDMIAACRSMAGDRDIRAFAIVAIDASGEACTQWDTGGIIPMWAFPGTVQRVLDFDLAQSGVAEDFKAPLIRPRPKRG